ALFRRLEDNEGSRLSGPQLVDQIVVHHDLGHAAVGHAAHEAGPAQFGIVDLEPEAGGQQDARRGDHPHDPRLLVRSAQDDHRQPDIGPVLRRDALNQHTLLGMGAGRSVAANLPVAVDGSDRALGMGAAAQPDPQGHDGSKGPGERGSATLMRQMQTTAWFAHYSVPDWSKWGARCTNRSHLDRTTPPA